MNNQQLESLVSFILLTLLVCKSAAHFDHGEGTDESNSNETSHTVDERYQSYEKVWIIHGLIGTITFALIMPISILCPIFRLSIASSWMKYHLTLTLISFIMIIVAFSVAVVTTESSGLEHFTETHHLIGLVLLILTAVQVIIGLRRPAKDNNTAIYNDVSSSYIEPDDRLCSGNYLKRRTIRQRWHIFHRTLGIFILCLGIYQIYDGWGMFADDYQRHSFQSLLVMWLFIFMFSVGVTWFVIDDTSPLSTTKDDVETFESELELIPENNDL
jgi:uncharacterized membrane protein (DUF373 family)